MNKLTSIATLVAVLLSLFTIPVRSLAQGPPPVQYYVSLGTSLAAGLQVDRQTGEILDTTDDAYTDQIHQRIRGYVKNLEHIKLGCPGETSQGMIDGIGSYCYTEQMSQLDAAKMFLAAHPGEIAFITLDIGANDLLPCLDLVDPGQVNVCVFNVITQLSGNLATVLTELDSVALDVPIVGMNYYNPYLAAWLEPGGEVGQTIAVSTTMLIAAINHALEGVYSAFGVPVGDVANAFDTYDFTLNGSAPPRNVRTICRLTWMCEHGNIHPNKNGYKVIARAVEDILRASVSTASTELALRLGEYRSLEEGGAIFLPAVGR